MTIFYTTDFLYKEQNIEEQGSQHQEQGVFVRALAAKARNNNVCCSNVLTSKLTIF